MPNVAYVRPEFSALLPRWNMIRDCLAGAAQVKARGDVYLPRPNPTDQSPENLARYAQYLQRAVFYGVTGRTLRGLVGQVMSDDAMLVLPPLLEVMEKDIDGGGVSLEQQSQKALDLVLAHGRAGLLADYPSMATGPATRQQLLDAEVRPVVLLLEPWDVINWRTISIGGVMKLALIVINESYVTDDDGYAQEFDDQWRVLRLDNDGLLVVEEWIRKPGTGKGTDTAADYVLKSIVDGAGNKTEAQYFPTDSSGKRLNYVPFTFIGAVNNDPTPDLPPMYDMAELNIAHYRNSADYEESCFIVGQPTPVLGGLTEDWVKTVLKGTVQLGSRGAIPLPAGGTAALLQAGPNSMPKEAMEAKERQMVALGARLVQQQKVARTATEAGQENASETSVLCAVTHNVSEAYEHALRWALAYVDVTADAEKVVQFGLNDDFDISTMTAQDRAQLIAEWQGGAITDEEMRAALTRSGVAFEDFDMWKQKSEEQALMKPIAPIIPMPGQPVPPGKKPAAMPMQKQQGTPAE